MLVVGHIGTQRFAWPAAAVERVLLMAAVTHVADLPASISGLLDVHGDTLVVVDARVRLGLAAAAANPEQHLVQLTRPRRYLLWVDRIDEVVSVDSARLQPIQSSELSARGAWSSTALYVTRLNGELVPVLSPAAFDPGSLGALWAEVA